MGLTFHLCSDEIGCKYIFIIPFYAVDTLLINFIQTENIVQHCFISIVVVCSSQSCICLHTNIFPYLISEELELIGFMCWLHILTRMFG